MAPRIQNQSVVEPFLCSVQHAHGEHIQLQDWPKIIGQLGSEKVSFLFVAVLWVQNSPRKIFMTIVIAIIMFITIINTYVFWHWFIGHNNRCMELFDDHKTTIYTHLHLLFVIIHYV